MELRERIRERKATMAVVGIGRVGLPLAISFAEAGLRVIGVDRNEDHVLRIQSGELPFIEEGAEPLLRRALQSGHFQVTTDAHGSIQSADIVVVTVGTPLGADMRADRSQVESALTSIGQSLHPGSLVVMRSTLSPGTTDFVVVPALERATGLEVGKNLFVAFCPERIAEGKAIEELRSLPEIIGGVESASGELAADLFQLLSPEKSVHLTDALSAELAKLFGNVYRYVTFALANEYGMIAEHYGRDAHEIISILRQGYPRAPVPLPGLAGGPCLSKDGYFLIEEITFPDFVLTAWKLNDSMPAHMVSRLAREMEQRQVSLKGAKVAVLGLAFKADIDDDRMSPSLRVVDALRRRGADVHTHDPYLPSEELEEALTDAVGVVIATNHSSYLELDPKQVSGWVRPECVVADCWGILAEEEWEHAGLTVLTLGKG